MGGCRVRIWFASAVVALSCCGGAHARFDPRRAARNEAQAEVHEKEVNEKVPPAPFEPGPDPVEAFSELFTPNQAAPEPEPLDGGGGTGGEPAPLDGESGGGAEVDVESGGGAEFDVESGGGAVFDVAAAAFGESPPDEPDFGASPPADEPEPEPVFGEPDALEPLDGLGDPMDAAAVADAEEAAAEAVSEGDEPQDAALVAEVRSLLFFSLRRRAMHVPPRLVSSPFPASVS